MLRYCAQFVKGFHKIIKSLLIACKPKIVDVVVSFLKILRLIDNKETKFIPKFWLYLTIETVASVVVCTAQNMILATLGEMSKNMSNALSERNPDPKMLRAFYLNGAYVSMCSVGFTAGLVGPKYLRDQFHSSLTKYTNKSINLRMYQGTSVKYLMRGDTEFFKEGFEVLHAWIRTMVAACIAMQYLLKIPSQSSIAGYKIPDLPLILLLLQFALERVHLLFLDKTTEHIIEKKRVGELLQRDIAANEGAERYLSASGRVGDARNATAEIMDQLALVERRVASTETVRFGWNTLSEQLSRVLALSYFGTKVYEGAVDARQFAVFANNLYAVVAYICFGSSTFVNSAKFFSMVNKIEGFISNDDSLPTKIHNSGVARAEYKTLIGCSRYVFKLKGFALWSGNGRVIKNFTQEFLPKTTYGIQCSKKTRDMFIQSLLSQAPGNVRMQGTVECRAQRDLFAQEVGVISDGFKWNLNCSVEDNVYFPFKPPSNCNVDEILGHFKLEPEVIKKIRQKKCPEDVFSTREGLDLFLVIVQAANLCVMRRPLKLIIINGYAEYGVVTKEVLEVLKEYFLQAAIIVLDKKIPERSHSLYGDICSIQDDGSVRHNYATNSRRGSESPTKLVRGGGMSATPTATTKGSRTFF